MSPWQNGVRMLVQAGPAADYVAERALERCDNGYCVLYLDNYVSIDYEETYVSDSYMVSTRVSV